MSWLLLLDIAGDEASRLAQYNKAPLSSSTILERSLGKQATKNKIIIIKHGLFFVVYISLCLTSFFLPPYPTSFFPLQPECMGQKGVLCQ